jgi:hypothetical protein
MLGLKKWIRANRFTDHRTEVKNLERGRFPALPEQSTRKGFSPRQENPASAVHFQVSSKKLSIDPKIVLSDCWMRLRRIQQSL